MAVTTIADCVGGMSTGRMRSLFNRQGHHVVDWVRALAFDGIAEAQMCYGRMLLEGTYLPKNEADAKRWFERAALNDHLDAINMVGRCYENGWGCEADAARAASCYHQAADTGHDWAQYNLGHLYLDGLGVERDAGRAFHYYRSAAAQGHARAMNLVGRCCEEGWGVPSDFIAAAQWYRRSAEAGYFRGQYNWATILLRSHREADAAVWFERAATSASPAVRSAVLKILTAAPHSEPITALTTRLAGSPSPV